MTASADLTQNLPLTTKAIAFDFDGTLVRSGKTGLDKGIHIMYAAYLACYACGFRKYLHPENPEKDTERMLRAYLRYPGAPRFKQLAAIVNCLVNDIPEAVADATSLGISKELQAEYTEVRERYNSLYSELNDIAAERYWNPFPSVKAALATLAKDYDLYIASGVTQDILEKDMLHHGFDCSLFKEIHGGNPAGGSDKGEILKNISAKGYTEVLFIADSNLDLVYAKQAEAKFYRIRSDEDYSRLLDTIPAGFPNEADSWDFTEEEKKIFFDKTIHLINAFLEGKALSKTAATEWINI